VAPRASFSSVIREPSTEFPSVLAWRIIRSLQREHFVGNFDEVSFRRVNIGKNKRFRSEYSVMLSS
jgi:hypothetical protein